MIAEIISVGTEIILGSTLNTNTYYLSKKLWEIGVDVLYHTSVKDNPKSLEQVIKIGLERSDILILTGGLGPTSDDITKEVVSKTLGLDLELNKIMEDNIKKYFSKNDQNMPSNNTKQAYLPKGAKFLTNEIGTAPGIYIEWNGRKIILLPGPPKEMALMFNKYVIPLIQQDFIIKIKTINTIGIGESSLETLLLDIIKEQIREMEHKADTGEYKDEVLNKGQSVWEKGKNFFTYRAFGYAERAASEALSVVKDVEFKMMETSRLVDEVGFSLDSYRDRLFGLAKDYGRDFDETADIAHRFVQAGYSVADSLHMTKVALLALNTAELDSSQATQSMIGIMQQWGMEAT